MPESALAIIPAFNEAAVIASTLDELRRALPHVDLLVVDDGSRDETASIAKAHGARVLTLPFNLGIGGALRTGFRWAIASGYTSAFQFDADGQHDPAEVPALLAPLATGVNLVVGSRFQQAGGYTVGRVRRGAMGSLRIMLRLLLRRSFTDTSSGFRAFDRPMMQFFATNYPAEYMESVEALFLACSEGFSVAEIPVQMRARAGGAPSNRRLRLGYHFVRLHLVLLASARRRRVPVVLSGDAG